MTTSYAVLAVSESSFNEIKAKLLDAEYHHVFQGDRGNELIVLGAIALRKEHKKPRRPNFTLPFGVVI
jgi:hypothetical protein